MCVYIQIYIYIYIDIFICIEHMLCNIALVQAWHAPAQPYKLITAGRDFCTRIASRKERRKEGRKEALQSSRDSQSLVVCTCRTRSATML